MPTKLRDFIETIPTDLKICFNFNLAEHIIKTKENSFETCFKVDDNFKKLAEICGCSTHSLNVYLISTFEELQSEILAGRTLFDLTKNREINLGGIWFNLEARFNAVIALDRLDYLMLINAKQDCDECGSEVVDYECLHCSYYHAEREQLDKDEAIEVEQTRKTL